MRDVEAKLTEILHPIRESGIQLQLQGEDVVVTTGGQSTRLRLTRLLRPSSLQVKYAAAPLTLLVLVNPSAKAAAAGSTTNHIVLPEGSYRLVVPGVALMREVPPAAPTQERRTRFQGRTGQVAETLLLAGKRAWSVHQLAEAASVSPALAHRVLARLDVEGWIAAHGCGPDKTRTLINPIALAEAWAQEEARPHVVLRGYLYGSTPQALMQKALDICPEGAVGGMLAAGTYAATATRLPYPLQFWVPEGFNMAKFGERGLEETRDGANLELVQNKGDHWRHHRRVEELAMVSPWRAWRESSAATGRARETSDALLHRLQGEWP